MGKKISPQNLRAVGTSATRLQGRRPVAPGVLKWSIGLTLAMAVWVTHQVYVLRFSIP